MQGTSQGRPIGTETSTGMAARSTAPPVAHQVLHSNRASHSSTQSAAKVAPAAAAGMHVVPGSLVAAAQQLLTLEPNTARDEYTAAWVQPGGGGCRLVHIPKPAETVPPTALGSAPSRFAKKARLR
jgi:hypothetical protein